MIPGANGPLLVPLGTDDARYRANADADADSIRNQEPPARPGGTAREQRARQGACWSRAFQLPVADRATP